MHKECTYLSQKKQKHGFKKSKSKATVGTLLQSLISRAADEDCYVIMTSLEFCPKSLVLQRTAVLKYSFKLSRRLLVHSIKS